MSDTLLLGVLGMPPELWHDDPLDIAQRYARYTQAAVRIRDDAYEIEALRAAVAALKSERKFAGWFTELPSATSYRIWEQGGADQKPGEVALYE